MLKIYRVFIWGYAVTIMYLFFWLPLCFPPFELNINRKRDRKSDDPHLLRLRIMVLEVKVE